MKRPAMAPRLLLLLAAVVAAPVAGHEGRGPPILAQLRAASSSRAGLRARARRRASSEEGFSAAVHKELFQVEVPFDLQDMEPSKGLSMVFDRKRDKMFLTRGIRKKEGLAWGRFDDNIDLTGWSELYIEAADTPVVTNDLRAYSAGFIEGVLTCVRISEFNANTRQLLIRKDAAAHALGKVRKLFRQQLKYMQTRTNVNRVTMSEEPEDAYWKHIRYVLFQMWGVCDGYNKVAVHFGTQPLGLEDFVVLNAAGELPQLMEAYSPPAREHRAASRPSLLQTGASKHLRRPPSVGGAGEDELDDLHWERRVIGSGRCSALVRLVPGAVDLLAGHTTWDDYSKMTRIFKYYKLPYADSDTMASHIAMSSYPGVVGSTDDFYIMDSGLGAMETSLIMMDATVWDGVQEFGLKPQIPNFAHIMAVNRLAKSAAHWSQLFMTVNTGTYTSQWLIMDYNMLDQGNTLRDGGLWVVEAIPGAMHAQDMTGYLRENGYFPSFNRPYFESIREKSGHNAAQSSHGALYSWAANPRAQIFAARAPAVTSTASMRALMEENTFPHTGFPGGTAAHEIAARFDLVEGLHTPNGGIDAKVVGRCLQKRMEVQAVSGPSHSSLAPFAWRGASGGESFPGWPHVGQPNVWNFTYVQMSPDGQGLIHDRDALQC